jgi:hypothetical protein
VSITRVAVTIYLRMGRAKHLFPKITASMCEVQVVTLKDSFVLTSRYMIGLS